MQDRLQIRPLLETIPAEVTGIDRERWIAILGSPGATGYPGNCGRGRCTRPVAADGECMPHWLSDGAHRSRGLR
jgi:hypothetical protein